MEHKYARAVIAKNGIVLLNTVHLWNLEGKWPRGGGKSSCLYGWSACLAAEDGHGIQGLWCDPVRPAFPGLSMSKTLVFGNVGFQAQEGRERSLLDPMCGTSISFQSSGGERRA